ncbi:MAG: hypothetical protein U0103_23810 [Candidatus Obscuribacterales bacterium]
MARRKAVEEIICSVDIERLDFYYLMQRWNYALRKLDARAQVKYGVDQSELYEKLLGMLRTLVLREICLSRPATEAWIGWYRPVLSTAKLTVEQVRDHLEQTRELSDEAIRAMFGDLPIAVHRYAQSTGAKGTNATPTA